MATRSVSNYTTVASPVDRAAAGFSDQGGIASWLHGDDGSASEVRLSLHAVAPGELAKFGRGVYLEIEGVARGNAAPLRKAVELKDGKVCIYLDPGAKAKLFEELTRHATIVSLHEAMAAEKMKPVAIAPRAAPTRRTVTRRRVR